MATEILNPVASEPNTRISLESGENKRNKVRPAETKGKGLYRKRKLEKIPAEISDTEDEDGAADRSLKRRKKARRARRRPYKGYYEMTDKERSSMEDRERLRADKIRERMRAKGHMLAPYNTTQFIISDQQDDKMKEFELQLDSKDLFMNSPTKVRKRGRDSSFSLDSDEGYFYSSPEDEEEFMCKEFSKDYENVHMEKLEKLDKITLIHEYINMEKKVDMLEKTLEEINTREEMKALTGEVDYEFHRGEIPMEPETALKIKIFQREITRLNKENFNLKKETSMMKRKFMKFHHSPSSSSASEDESVQELLEDKPRTEYVDVKTEDTGYESTQSKEQTPEPDWSKETKEKPTT
ncbi:protein HEXIM [Eurytemora carolleeae]|uniref:protein HEXIM n=1 Tax=Eurytemora carolleeae TaxID=1294199 RepID=UPI000C77A276|nr:protein HEXIM [Eurytemora carolleeae]|eukprot:XP_023324284.1 protein HEXIM-like [Eurytemora affinis]